MNKLKSIFSRKRLLIGSICLTIFSVGVSTLSVLKFNKELKDNFRIVTIQSSDLYLLQEKTCGGYYVYKSGYIKPLQNPDKMKTFNQSTTIIDNLGGEQNGRN